MKKFTVYLLLGILLFLSIFIRLKAFPRNPIYISDSALRFRYAKMVAQGEKIPEVDYMLQYPEGIQPSSSDFLTEDKIAGYSYRLLNKILPEMDFAQFLKYFISVLSSLSLLPLFIIGLLVWKNIPASLTGLTFWTFSVGSFGRSVGNYLREEFALPFLFLFIALFIAGIQRKNKFLPFGAGFSLFIALSSWHLSQFFFLVFVVFAWIFFIFCILKRDRQEFQFLLTSLVPILIFSVLSSVLNPPLRVRFFLFSTPMMLLYTLFI